MSKTPPYRTAQHARLPPRSARTSDTLLNEYGTVDSYRFDALSRLGGISYGAVGEKWDVPRGGVG